MYRAFERREIRSMSIKNINPVKATSHQGGRNFREDLRKRLCRK